VDEINPKSFRSPICPAPATHHRPTKGSRRRLITTSPVMEIASTALPLAPLPDIVRRTPLKPTQQKLNMRVLHDVVLMAFSAFSKRN